ncbi:MAG: type II toxin-antitoxin system YafQ family toxin [Ruminococcus sp.]
MLTIKYHSLFKKDFKRIKKRGYDIAKMEKVISLLVNETPLPEIYKDHDLKGDYKGCRECHITPDWLLVYQKNIDDLVLILTRTGSHSDLF